MNDVHLGPGAEFDLIRELLARWGARATGVGDDAAVVDVPRGDQLVASVDAAVEDRHFRTRYFTPREIGYRAAAAALSDLAAMAARPLGVLVAIELPDDWRGRLMAVADGIGDAVDVAHAKILGGNLSGADRFSITTTVLGSAFRPLSRATARAGDLVYVTGRLGGAAEALRRLEAGESAAGFRDRLCRPRPRLAEARWLAERGASAGIDISDGLAADTAHVANASRVSLELDAACIPCADGIDVEVALQSGEEYELLVSSPRAFDVAEFERQFGLPLTAIGHVVDGEPGRVRVAGARVAHLHGHNHFSR